MQKDKRDDLRFYELTRAKCVCGYDHENLPDYFDHSPVVMMIAVDKNDSLNYQTCCHCCGRHHKVNRITLDRIERHYKNCKWSKQQRENNHAKK